MFSHPICYRLPIRVILFIVYTAFCDSVAERIWNKYGVILTVEVLLIFVCLFRTVSLLIYLTSRAARLNREDAIAVYFCSVKKTLAMGVPLAVLIFWLSRRSQSDFVADYVLSPVPAFGERIVGEPVGESTNDNERWRAAKDMAHADQLEDTKKIRKSAQIFSSRREK
jgi:hypothetical protein